MSLDRSQLELFETLENTSDLDVNSPLNTAKAKIGMRPISIEWLAGYIDGEGCFLISGRSTPVVKINSCHFDVLCRISDQFGGKIYNHSKSTDSHRASWTWHLGGDAALDLSASLLPHLIEKRSQAVALMALPTCSDHQRQYVMDFLKEEKKPFFEHLESNQ